jgi:type I restriction enzyme, S subunit
LGHPNPRSENDGAGSGMNALMKEVRDTAGSYVLAEVAGDAVPAGYKRTEVGVIPEDWDVIPLGALLNKGRLGGNYANQISETPSPLMKMGNIGRGPIDLQRVEYIRDGIAIDPVHRLQVGDVLFNTRNTLDLVGKVAIWRGELPVAYYNSNLMRLEFSQDRICSSEFANYALNSEKCISGLRALATGTTSVAAIYTRDLMSFRLAVPSPKEQRAIAAALSDVDALLLGLDQLIAKKRDLKQAAMQQLLTGQIRLPGFGDEWCKTQLGRLGRFSKGKGIRKDQVMTDGLPCVRYGEIYTRHHDVIRSFGSFISPGVASQSQRLLRGDLLFAGSGETAEEIGKCVAFLGDVEAYAGGDIVIFSPTKQDSVFLGYLMNAPKVAAQKARMGQGDAVVHIGAKNLAQLEFSLPSLEEQTAIATILSDMDAELATLETRRAKTRELKQGMMQALLTGRIRLT